MLRHIRTVAIAAIALSGLAKGNVEAAQIESPVATRPAEDVPPEILNRARLVERLSAPVTQRDMVRYQAWVRLAEPQVVLWRRQLSAYEASWSSFFRDQVVELKRRNAAACDRFKSGVIDDQAVALYAQFHEQQNLIAARMAESDRALLDQWRLVLNPEQLTAFARVELHRQRATCWRLDASIKAARLDLSAIADELPLDPGQRERIDTVLVGYERQLTPLLLALHEQFVLRELPLQDMHSRMWQLSGSRDESTEQRQFEAAFDELDAERLKWLARGADLQVQIRELNQSTLEQLMVVDAGCCGMIAAEYRRLAYPLVFPDPTDVDRVIEDVSQRTDVSLVVQQRIDALVAEHQAEYRRLCNEMTSQIDRWEEQMARTTTASDFDLHQAAMRTWRDDRINLNDTTVRRLRELLPEQDRIALASTWREHERGIKRIRMQYAQDERWPGP